MRVAIIGNHLWKLRGAERLIGEILTLYPNADVFAYCGKQGLWEEQYKYEREIRFSPINKLPFISKLYKLMIPFEPLANYLWDFTKYDLVISVSSSFQKSIFVPNEVKHLCIVLTPARYLWDLSSKYFRWVPQILLKPFRFFDSNTNQFDYSVAISEYVNERMGQYWGFKADSILYPPVDFESIGSYKNFATADSNTENDLQSFKAFQRYILGVNCFDQNNGYEEIIKFVKEHPNISFKFIGEGTMRKKMEVELRELDVELLGWVSEQEKYKLIYEASGLFNLGREDFGITGVESIFLRTPLIASKVGGHNSYFINGVNGMIYDEDFDISHFMALDLNKDDIQSPISQFSKGRFHQNLQRIIDDLMNN